MTTAPLRIPSSAERLYHTLLVLYPRQFRQTFGQEMLLTFRDCYREAQQAQEMSKTWVILRFWSLVLSDLAATVCREHARAALTHVKILFGIEKESFMANVLFNLDIAQQTDIGNRATNEDNMIAYVPEDERILAMKGALFVVADGMGGHTKGDVASELTINTVRDVYYRSSESDNARALQQALQEANTRIYTQNAARFGQEAEQQGMGTTCVAAVLHGDTIAVANAGDSLAYIVNTGQMRQIAQNHSWVAEQVRTGAMSEAEARAQGKNNMITRAIGTSPDVEIYVTTEQVHNGDTLLLCTDGLHTLIDEDELRAIVEHYEPQESVARLVQRAKENGGPDNITAVVVHISLP